MNRALQAAIISLLALSLAAIATGGCATDKQGKASENKTTPVPKEPAQREPAHSLSALLPTLEVAGDACHVFLKPEERSAYFGPLLKGEKIKWLDAEGDWIRVWIPRLRISGWISSAKTYETSGTPLSPEAVPEELLSTVAVATKRANIRESPTILSEIITVVKRGEKFQVLNKKSGWCQVWLPDLKKTGWISAKIVTRQRKK